MQFSYFIRWIYRCWVNDKSILLILVFEIFSDFLCTQTKFFDAVAMTFWTARRDSILCFANMAKSDSISWFNLMITDTYRTVFTLGNMSAVVANNPSWISFFVDEDSDFLPLCKILFNALMRQLRKIRSNLLAHIDQKNRFFLSLNIMLKAFVVHSIVCSEI